MAPHDRELLLTYYREMLLIRRFEEKAGQLGMGLIGGFCHLYIGQEAVAVGTCSTRCGKAIRSSPTGTTVTC